MEAVAALPAGQPRQRAGPRVNAHVADGARLHPLELTLHIGAPELQRRAQRAVAGPQQRRHREEPLAQPRLPTRDETEIPSFVFS